MVKIKESELIEMAMAAVIDDSDYAVDSKIAVLEVLFEKRSLALFAEQNKGGENK